MNPELPLPAIEPFVRECLGCNCPPSVFNKVENDHLELGGIRYQRLLAGDRLLVYLLLNMDPEKIADQLDSLQRAGIAERDGAGYNRLRIVVPGRLEEHLRRMLSERFELQASGDEKVHLHFVPGETLKRYLVR